MYSYRCKSLQKLSSLEYYRCSSFCKSTSDHLVCLLVILRRDPCSLGENKTGRDLSRNSTEMSSWSTLFCIGFSDASNLRFLRWTFILVVVVSHGLLFPRLWLLAFSNITNSKRKTRMAFMRRLLFAFHNNVPLFCWFSFQLSLAVVMTDFGNCRCYAIIVSSMLLSLCSREDWVLCHMLFESSGVAASSQLKFWYICLSVVLCLSLSF
jgi:hypothetical protein